MTADNPIQQRLLDDAKPLIGSKVDELNETILLRNTEGFDAALQLVKTDAGKDFMDRFRVIIASMTAEEDRELENRERTLELYEIYALAINLVGFVMLILVGSYVVYRVRVLILLRNETEKRLHLEKDRSMRLNKELMTLNDDLEDRIEERTASLVKARDEADAANHAKSTFLSSMSHELRTPLNAILGFGQMLEGNPKAPLTESQASCVQHILSGGGALVDLIDKILSFSEISDGQTPIMARDVDIKELAHKCLERLKSKADKNEIKLISNFPDERLPKIWVDPKWSEEILTTFLSNAVLYNHDGGEVRVDSSVETEGRLRISVSDTGQGIPKESFADVFQPFKRLGKNNTSISGAGIGLALAKRMSELMGGRVGFNSEEGKGSTFWVEFPVAHDV